MDYLKAAKEKITSSNALTGNAEKAYLLVRKDIMKEEDKATDNFLQFADTLQNGVDIISNAASLLSMNGALYAIANERGYIPIKVQYNPSSITFTGLKGVQDQSHEGAFMNFDRPVETVMGMELYFDTMEANNAFMMDKTAKDVVTGLVKKKKSVRYIVELLIGATVFPSTRWIGFACNKMIFWGELVNVNASYIMFDTKGEPVRAKVSLQIRQDQVTQAAEKGKEKTKENRKKEEKEWDKQFKALGKKKPKMSSSVSNILNTNF